MVKIALGRQTAALGRRAAYRVHPLRDAQRIRSFLGQDRAYAVFALGHLEPRLFAASQWWLAQGEGGSALLLHSRTTLGPALAAMGDPQALAALLSLHPGPRFTFATFQVEQLPIMERYFVVEQRRPMLRLVVTAETFRPLDGEARRLRGSDIGSINRLYATQGGGYYTARHIAENVYYGVLDEGGRLVSIAGTHVVAPSEGVAVVGNVYTHPRYRGRGYATIATGAVAAELLRTCPLVALTVDPDNVPAVRAYERLGFQHHGLLMESGARRRDVLGLAGLARRWRARRRGGGQGEEVVA